MVEKIGTCDFGIRIGNVSALTIWIVAALVLTGLTIKDFIPLLNLFKYDNIETNAVITLENLTLHLPDLAFCFTTDETPGQMKNVIDVLIASNYSLEENITSITKSDLDRLSNSSLIAAALIVLRAFDFLDSTPEHVQKNLAFLQNLNLNLTDRVSPEKLDPLADSIIQIICLDVLDTGGEGGMFQTDADIGAFCSNLKSETTPFIISSEKFCFPLPLGSKHFTRMDNIASVFFRRQASVLKWSSISFFDNDIARYGSALYELYSSRTRSLTANFRISSRVRNDATRSWCKKEPNFDTCLFKCALTNVRDKCGCFPFSYRLWNNRSIDQMHNRSIDYCRKSDYVDCLKKVGSMENILEAHTCVKLCQSLCECSFYQWSFQEVTDEISNLQDTVTVTFRPDSFSYIEFKLADKMSVEQFLTQLGGLLNFYIGCSGLTIFTALLALSNWMKRNEVVKRAVATAARGPDRRSNARPVFDPTAGLWQWWWLKQLAQKTKEEEKRRDEIRLEVETVAESLGWLKPQEKESYELQAEFEKKMRKLEEENANLFRKVQSLENLIMTKLASDAKDVALEQECSEIVMAERL